MDALYDCVRVARNAIAPLVADIEFEHVLVFHSIAFVAMMVHRHREYFAKGYHYFLTDCCYLFNYALIPTYFWLYNGAAKLAPLVLVDYGGHRVALTPSVVRGAIFVGASCYCGFGVLMWRNALLWGDFGRLISFYLHFAPAALCFLERWYYSAAAATAAGEPLHGGSGGGGGGLGGFISALFGFGGSGGDTAYAVAALDYEQGAIVFVLFFVACCALQAAVFAVWLPRAQEMCSFRFMGNQFGAHTMPHVSLSFVYFHAVQLVYIGLTVYLSRYFLHSFKVHALFLALLLASALAQGWRIAARKAKKRRRRAFYYGISAVDDDASNSSAGSSRNVTPQQQRPSTSKRRRKHRTPMVDGKSPRTKLLDLLNAEALSESDKLEHE